MAETLAQKRANGKYRSEKVDVINVLVEKGSRAIYKQVAERMGVSVSRFFRLAAEEYLRNHMGGEFETDDEEVKILSEREEEMLDEFGKLPPGVQRSVTVMLRSINKMQ